MKNKAQNNQTVLLLLGRGPGLSSLENKVNVGFSVLPRDHDRVSEQADDHLGDRQLITHNAMSPLQRDCHEFRPAFAPVKVQLYILHDEVGGKTKQKSSVSFERESVMPKAVIRFARCQL